MCASGYVVESAETLNGSCLLVETAATVKEMDHNQAPHTHIDLDYYQNKSLGINNLMPNHNLTHSLTHTHTHTG